MPALLHIDSSLNLEGSASRGVTNTFAQAWRAANPGAAYVYRDLASAGALAHLDLDGYVAEMMDGAHHTPAQAARWAEREQIVAEVLAADTILIGAPMYNLSIPSPLKAWIDHLVMPRFFADPTTGRSALSGRRVIIATARGGSYAAGSPRAALDFQEPYLRAILGYIGLGHDLSFIHTELTLASVIPALAPYIEFGVISRDNALKAAAEAAVR
jgi:FMN-dependent NADH-azoreductase